MPNVGRSSAADMRTVMPLSAVSLSHSRRIAATSDPSPSAVGVSPVTITRASARFSRAVVWINSRYLGLADTSLSDLWGLAGLDADSTLSQTATNLGLGDLPIANLYWLIGITDDDTLQQTVNALGIGDTPLDTLLQDWGVLFRSGDGSAWEELVRRHSRRIYNICYRFTGNRTESEDLSQEVFLRVYRTLASYREAHGGFGTWMTSVTRNLLIDHYRRTKRDRQTDSLDDAMPAVESKESSARRPDQHAMLGELSEQVQAA